MASLNPRNPTHRLLSSSFLGIPYRIPNTNHNKELLRSLWVNPKKVPFMGFQMRKRSPRLRRPKVSGNRPWDSGLELGVNVPWGLGGFRGV